MKRWSAVPGVTGVVMRVCYRFANGRTLSLDVSSLGILALPTQRMAVESDDGISHLTFIVRPDEQPEDPKRCARYVLPFSEES